MVKLDHVGYITRDIKKFESFWVTILGFTVKHTSVLPLEATKALFGLNTTANIVRYTHPQWNVDIEIHQFEDLSIKNGSYWYSFDRPGINHLCLHTGGKGSRNLFLSTLPDGLVEVIKYKNPGGWDNIFLQDFEGNWIELRENLNE